MGEYGSPERRECLCSKEYVTYRIDGPTYAVRTWLTMGASRQAARVVRVLFWVQHTAAHVGDELKLALTVTPL